MASTSDSDSVRRLLYGGSTRSGSLSTGDVDAFVDENPNVWLAASEAALAEGARYGGLVEKQVGDLRLRYGESQKRWLDVAASLRRRGLRKVTVFAGGITQTGKDAELADSDRVGSAFTRDQFDYDSGGGSTGDFY